ncbi:FliA/WhiG family RNA polymerase sigma factor [bacterium]|nr:FliA/WhiG family RNA polymerase sigma factor [bacterium]
MIGYGDRRPDAGNMDEAAIWNAYAKNRNEHYREKLVLQYIPLVKYVIGRQLAHLPDHLSRDDLMSAGIVGLIDAVEKFNPELKVQFKTFAIPRVKGAILDELRSYDIIPRSIRMKMREVQQVMRSLEGKLGRGPYEEEIAVEMGLSVQEYRDLLRKLAPIRFLSLSHTLNNDADWELASSDAGPGLAADNEEVKQLLVEAIQNLDKNERLTIALYYYEKMTMKEIGMVLKVSESRVSQVHTQAILKLRSSIQSSIS